MLMTEENSSSYLYVVVIRDKLNNKPKEYAIYETESEAVKIMTELLQQGIFAAVGKKRILNKENC